MKTFGDPINQVGSYKLIGHLGRGNFADVYLGEHVTLHRRAAVKVLHASLEPVDPNADTFPPNKPGSLREIDSEEKLRAEMQIIASFDHPNIIPIWEGGLTNQGEPYFVMPVVKETLEQRIGRRTIKDDTLSFEEILEYLFPVAQALGYLHHDDRAYVHGDLKPANILRKEDGTIMLADFGGALLTRSPNFKAITDKPAFINTTFAYMPPERLDPEDNIRRASDQYAVGVIVYRWISGRYPFAGKHEDEIVKAILLSNPPRFAALGVHVDDAIEMAVRRALAKKPEDRFPSVLAFVKALEASRTRNIRQVQAPTQKQKDEEEKRELLTQFEEQLRQANERIARLESQLYVEQKAANKEKRRLEDIMLRIQAEVEQAHTTISELEGEKGRAKMLQGNNRQLRREIQQLQQSNDRLAESERQLQTQLQGVTKTSTTTEPPVTKAQSLPEEDASDSSQRERDAGAQKPSQRRTRASSIGAAAALGLSIQPQQDRRVTQPGNTVSTETAEAYYNRACQFQEHHSYQEALVAFDQALRIDPNLVKAHKNRGDVLRELKRYPEALAAYDQALRLDPNPSFVRQNLILHVHRGDVLRELKRYPEALAAYDQALKINPNLSLVKNGRRRVLRELKQ